MYYSDTIIDEVISRNDIVDVISSYVKLQKKGSNYFGLCPFHNERTGSFCVSASKQMYYCFGCGAGGSVVTFIMQYENYTFTEALKLLADRAGIKLPEYEPTMEERKARDKKALLLEINKAAANYFYKLLNSEEGEAGLSYFRNRKLRDETIVHFGLGYSSKRPGSLYRYLKEKGYKDEILKESGLVTIEEKGVKDKFWNRVMFPILDANNRVIGFGGRVMGDGEPKYLNSPETLLFDKSKNLYGLNFARSSKKDYFLLCEGYMDVIALHQAGFTNAVASLGTALTQGHTMLIKRYVSKVVLTYDSDGAGLKAMQRAIPILKAAGISARVLSMKPYKDPDEFIKALGADEYEKRIEAANNSFLWEADILRQGYDTTDPEQKTAYYKELARRLSGFEEPIERDNYIQAVCKQQFINYDDMKKLVNTYGLKIQPKTTFDNRAEKLARKKEKDDGLLKSQRMLLTWMIDDKSLYEQIKEYISPNDFENELYKEVAKKVYEARESETFTPAALVTYYSDSEEKQRAVAKLFNTSLEGDVSDEEKKKAIAESIIKVKRAALDRLSQETTDLERLQQVIRQQAEYKNKRITIV